MLGELLLAVMDGAMNMDESEKSVQISQNEAMNVRERAAADVKVAKEETKRVIIENVFAFLGECAKEGNNTTK